MAVIRRGDKVVVTPDNASIIPACKELDIPFGCEIGACKSCCRRVVSGMQHLTPKTEEEERMKLTKDQRLCCQCKIISGEVELE